MVMVYSYDRFHTSLRLSCVLFPAA
jgi:hypothetical protein